MKFYLYYCYGSCNDGSCDRGLKEFDTLAEAETEMQHILDTRLNDDPDCTIIQGVEVRVVECVMGKVRTKK